MTNESIALRSTHVTIHLAGSGMPEKASEEIHGLDGWVWTEAVERDDGWERKVTFQMFYFSDRSVGNPPLGVLLDAVDEFTDGLTLDFHVMGISASPSKVVKYVHNFSQKSLKALADTTR